MVTEQSMKDTPIKLKVMSEKSPVTPGAPGLERHTQEVKKFTIYQQLGWDDDDVDDLA
jgi:hypothetical protein